MTESRPAGFWIRAVAAAVDLGLVSLVQFSLGFTAGLLWGAAVEERPAFPLLVVVFTLVFAVAYTTLLHGLTGQTVGKLLVGVHVVGPSGRPPGLAPAFLRYLGYFGSLAPLGLGFAMAGLRADRRALHDLVAGTRVERRPRAEAPPEPAPVPATAPPQAP